MKAQLDQVDKNPRDVLWQLARLYQATKRPDQALQCLRRILASESDLEVKAGCVLALGQTMEQCNDFPAAIRFYREAMAMEPIRNDTWYFIHNNLGYCYNQVTTPEFFIKDSLSTYYAAATAQSPSNSRTYFTGGLPKLRMLSW